MKVKDFERMNKHQAYFRDVLPEILPTVKNIQDKLKNNESVELIMSKHSRYREVKREISYRSVLNVIRSGRIIEYQGSKDRRDELDEFRDMERSDEKCVNVILMKKVFSNGEEKYVHVCVNIQGDSVVVKTVYDPSSKYWQWTNNYSKRVFYKEKRVASHLCSPQKAYKTSGNKKMVGSYSY